MAEPYDIYVKTKNQILTIGVNKSIIQTAYETWEGSCSDGVECEINEDGIAIRDTTLKGGFYIYRENVDYIIYDKRLPQDWGAEKEEAVK